MNSQGPYAVFGTHAVRAILLHSPHRARRLWLQNEGDRLDDITGLAKRHRIETRQAGRDQITKLCKGDPQHQGVALECAPFDYSDLDALLSTQPSLLLVLDGVEDPRNLGRCARSAFAMGAAAIVIPKDRAAQVSPAAEKAAVGALAQLPVVQVTNLARALQQMKDAGLWIVGTSDKATDSLWQGHLKDPCALVIGSEDKGLRRLTQESCDQMVLIPMVEEGFSLNAADAASLCLYEAMRQRQIT